MATKMAQQARRKYQQQQQAHHQQLTRSHSLEGVLSYYGQTEHDDVVLGDGGSAVFTNLLKSFTNTIQTIWMHHS